MNERDALYRTICEKPEDDTARLVFADWLQEHGDEARAEFIRVQCRLAGMTAGDPEYVLLRMREHLLFDAHSEDWTADDTPAEGLDVSWYGPESISVQCWFVRGFPEWPTPMCVDGSLKEYRDILRQVLVRTPTRRLHFESWKDDLDDPKSWLANPDLEKCHGLIVQNRFDGNADRVANLFACSGRFAALDQLHQQSTGLSDVGLKHYALGRELPRLTELGLNLSDEVSATGWQRFGRSALARRLRSLKLDGTGLTDEVLEELADAKWPQLHQLYLGSSTQDSFGATGLRALAESDGLSRLRSLRIAARTLDRLGIIALGKSERLILRELTISGGSGINSSNAAAFAKGKSLSTLRSLNLDADRLSDRAVSALARSPHLANLEWLTLPGAVFGGDGLRALLTSERWTELALLSVPSGTRTMKVLGAEVLTALKEMNLPSIRDLTLMGWPVGVRGARALASNPSVEKLKFLDLRQCRLGDKGVAALIESPHLQGIEFLDLGGNGISDGIVGLADPGVMPNLRKCHLHDNPLTDATKRRLRDRPRTFEPYGATH